MKTEYCTGPRAIKVAVVAFLLSVFCPLLITSANGQVVNSGVADYFTNASEIGTRSGVITQLAFDPNDDDHLYVATWMNGIWRYDYSQGGASLTNGAQIVSPDVELDRDSTHENGSYGIAFHDDPVHGSVMYLSRALQNDTSFTPRTQGLGSIVRINDANGDGIWGGAGDLNQTIADNIYMAQWTHQINQFAIHGNSLYIGAGSLTSNGGVNFGAGALESGQAAIGEAAHTASVLFIEDLTLIGTGDNAAYFDIGSDIIADELAFRTDTNVFTSTDPAKLRVFSTGLRNPFGIAVNDDGDVFVTNNQGGATPSLQDQLYLAQFQDDHGFNKAGDDVGGSWKDPSNSDPSVVAAQTAGYFQSVPDPQASAVALLGANSSATGLDFVRADGNPFDNYAVVARHSNSGQDVVLVNLTTGAMQNLLDQDVVGVSRPTDVVRDPYGDLVIGYATDQIRFVEVVGGTDTMMPGATVCFDFESPTPVFPTDGSNDSVGTNPATNFNLFDTQAADGATVSQTGFINQAGDSVPGLGLEITNNLGKETGLTGVVSNMTTVSPFNETTIYSDSYGAANVGNMDRADFGELTDESNIVLTFTGLDDELCYNVTGGGAFDNNNFDTIWTAGFVSATTDSTSTTGGEFVTLSNLVTDGSGNLTVTVRRANVQICFSAVCIEAVEADKVELVEQFAACFDFESPTPAFPTDGSNAGVGTNPATNFNLFDTQAADGATVSFSGVVIDLAGAPVAGVGLDVTNNLGKATGLTGVVSNMTISPFDDTSIYSDNYGAANVGNMDRADFGELTDESNIVLTFTGLDDELCYNVTGGGAFDNNNFDTIWTAGFVSATTDSTSTTGGEFVTLSNLVTDGSGNLTVTVRRANVQILFSAVTIRAFEKVDGSDVLIGDVNLDGIVGFDDVPLFIDRVLTSTFQAEADIDGDGEVGFDDVVPFIDLILGASEVSFSGSGDDVAIDEEAVKLQLREQLISAVTQGQGIGLSRYRKAATAA